MTGQCRGLLPAEVPSIKPLEALVWDTGGEFLGINPLRVEGPKMKRQG